MSVSPFFEDWQNTSFRTNIRELIAYFSFKTAKALFDLIKSLLQVGFDVF